MSFEEKLKVPKLPVVECPHCFIPILLTETNTRRVYSFMAKPHEHLDCLQFGRMLKRLNPYTVAKLKLYVKKNIPVNGEPIKTLSNQKEFADILLQLKK